MARIKTADRKGRNNSRQKKEQSSKIETRALELLVAINYSEADLKDTPKMKDASKRSPENVEMFPLLLCYLPE